MTDLTPARDDRRDATPTFTGNRALMLEEPLIFEMGLEHGTGVDVDGADPASGGSRLGGLERHRPIDLP
ncbi:MAG TPA: hypothetical protein VM865_03010, partial [Acidobacteriaceae bacterium]|nr:hypothetical protein [Acidobacteriaceae bacterium]